jgi:hypothetical protein
MSPAMLRELADKLLTGAGIAEREKNTDVLLTPTDARSVAAALIWAADELDEVDM